MTTRRELREQQNKVRRAAKVTGRVITWVAGSIVVAVAAGYLGLIAYLGTGTPFTATVGHSMNPTLYEGDLAVIKQIVPAQVHVGDVIRMNITTDFQSKLGLPNTILHRVVAIRNSANGLMFTTKGDNNPLNDIFETRADNVTGIMVAHYSRWGYILLTLQSPSAPILGLVALALIAAYLVIGWLESSMNAAKSRERVLRDLVEEIPILTKKIEELSARHPAPEGTSFSQLKGEDDGSELK